jgi:hypothetical protein
MHADQLFPTYLSQPGMLPPPPHAGGRTPKDPRGFQALLLRLRTRVRVDTGPQSEPQKPLGSPTIPTFNPQFSTFNWPNLQPPAFVPRKKSFKFFLLKNPCHGLPSPVAPPLSMVHRLPSIFNLQTSTFNRRQLFLEKSKIQITIEEQILLPPYMSLLFLAPPTYAVSAPANSLIELLLS